MGQIEQASKKVQVEAEIMTLAENNQYKVMDIKFINSHLKYGIETIMNALYTLEFLGYVEFDESRASDLWTMPITPNKGGISSNTN